MFKENKEFWMYFVGIIFLFFVLFYILREVSSGNNILGVGFNLSRRTSSSARLTTTPSQNNNLSPTLPLNKNYQALFKTNKGDFRVDLFEQSAPNNVANFINLANQGYYNNNKFFRLIPNVLIQSGSKLTTNQDPNDDSFDSPGYTIKHEVNWDSLDYDDFLRNQLITEGYTSAVKLASKDVAKYRIAMSANGPDTAGSQFFIILGDITDERIKYMRGRFTIIGEVIDGKNIIDLLGQTQVDDINSNSPRPQENLIINQIIITQR